MDNYFSSSTSMSTLPEVTEEHVIIKTTSTGWQGGLVIAHDLGLPTDGVLEFVVNMNTVGFYSSALNFYFGLCETKETYDCSGTYGIPVDVNLYYLYDSSTNCYTQIADYKFVINFTDNTIRMFKGETQVLYTICAFDKLVGKDISLLMGIGSYGYAGTATINGIKISHNGTVITENALKADKFLIKSEGNYYSILPEQYDLVNKKFKELTTTNLTEDIKTYGFGISKLTTDITIDTETFKPISKFTSISLIANSEKNIEITAVKNDKEMIVSNQNLSTIAASVVKNFILEVDKISNGNIKFVVSDDNGINWKTWNGTSWKVLTNKCPLTDKNIVKQYSQLSDSEKNKWDSLKDEIWTSGIETTTTSVDYTLLNKNVRFAFVLYRHSYSDNITLKNVSMLYDKIGNWHKLSEADIDVAINTNSCSVTAKLENLTNVKVNILI